MPVSTFAQRLKELGWTKAGFARHIGVSPETVTRWGNDPPLLAIRYLDICEKYIKQSESLVRFANKSSIEVKLKLHSPS